MKYISKSIDDTQNIANNIAKKIKVGDILLLTGDLGAGKTTFTKALCNSLGISDMVTSPTFTIVNEYCGPVKVYHLDLYRIETLDEALGFGLDEIINNRDGIYLVEWPQVALPLFTKNCISINISKIDENTREFDIKDE